jgi:hypothetical protein
MKRSSHERRKIGRSELERRRQAMGTTKRRHMPSPALAVSILALAVASVGTAGALPGKGKVKTNDLAKNSVRKAAIKTDAVTGRAIAGGAVGPGELVDGSVGAEKLGPSTIAVGNTNGFSDIAVDGVWSPTSSLATCPQGTRLTGGGVFGNPAGGSARPELGRVQVTVSYPEDEDTWRVAGASDNGPGGGDITAYAVCLD